MPREEQEESKVHVSSGLRLTWLVDARVVAELQDVEVPALRATPNAVDAGDVGALVLHVEQSPHQVFVAVVPEVYGLRHAQQQRPGQCPAQHL